MCFPFPPGDGSDLELAFCQLGPSGFGSRGLRRRDPIKCRA